MRATALGWLLSIPVIVLLALAGEAVGIGGSQGIVGLGAGLGVAVLQARIVRRERGRAWDWLVVSGLAVAVPFLVTDVARAMGRPLPYSLPICLATGGAIAGLGQSILTGRNRLAWFLASAFGWSAAAGLVAAAEQVGRGIRVAGIAGALLFLGMAACGGLALGTITSLARGRNR